jgi:hypothetical protein
LVECLKVERETGLLIGVGGWVGFLQAPQTALQRRGLSVSWGANSKTFYEQHFIIAREQSSANGQYRGILAPIDMYELTLHMYGIASEYIIQGWAGD